MKLLNYLYFNMFGSVLECCELTGVSFEHSREKKLEQVDTFEQQYFSG